MFHVRSFATFQARNKVNLVMAQCFSEQIFIQLIYMKYKISEKETV